MLVGAPNSGTPPETHSGQYYGQQKAPPRRVALLRQPYDTYARRLWRILSMPPSLSSASSPAPALGSDDGDQEHIHSRGFAHRDLKSQNVLYDAATGASSHPPRPSFPCLHLTSPISAFTRPSSACSTLPQATLAWTPLCSFCGIPMPLWPHWGLHRPTLPARRTKAGDPNHKGRRP